MPVTTCEVALEEEILETKDEDQNLEPRCSKFKEESVLDHLTSYRDVGYRSYDFVYPESSSSESLTLSPKSFSDTNENSDGEKSSRPKIYSKAAFQCMRKLYQIQMNRAPRMLAINKNNLNRCIKANTMVTSIQRSRTPGYFLSCPLAHTDGCEFSKFPFKKHPTQNFRTDQRPFQLKQRRRKSVIEVACSLCDYQSFMHHDDPWEHYKDYIVQQALRPKIGELRQSRISSEERLEMISNGFKVNDKALAPPVLKMKPMSLSMFSVGSKSASAETKAQLSKSTNRDVIEKPRFRFDNLIKFSIGNHVKRPRAARMPTDNDSSIRNRPVVCKSDTAVVIKNKVDQIFVTQEMKDETKRKREIRVAVEAITSRVNLNEPVNVTNSFPMKITKQFSAARFSLQKSRRKPNTQENNENKAIISDQKLESKHNERRQIDQLMRPKSLKIFLKSTSPRKCGSPASKKKTLRKYARKRTATSVKKTKKISRN